jgi:hypothetical protein
LCRFDNTCSPNIAPVDIAPVETTEHDDDGDGESDQEHFHTDDDVKHEAALDMAHASTEEAHALTEAAAVETTAGGISASSGAQSEAMTETVINGGDNDALMVSAKSGEGDIIAAAGDGVSHGTGDHDSQHVADHAVDAEIHIVNASAHGGESPVVITSTFEEESGAIQAFASAGADADTIAEVAEIDANSIEVVAASGGGPEVLTEIAHAEAETIETAVVSGADPLQIAHDAEEEAHAMEEVESPADLNVLVQAADIAHNIAILTVGSEVSKAVAEAEVTGVVPPVPSDAPTQVPTFTNLIAEDEEPPKCILDCAGVPVNDGAMKSDWCKWARTVDWDESEGVTRHNAEWNGKCLNDCDVETVVALAEWAQNCVGGGTAVLPSADPFNLVSAGDGAGDASGSYGIDSDADEAAGDVAVGGTTASAASEQLIARAADTDSGGKFAVSQRVYVPLVTAICTSAVGLAFVLHSRRAALAEMDTDKLRGVIGVRGRPWQQTPCPDSTNVLTAICIPPSTLEGVSQEVL